MSLVLAAGGIAASSALIATWARYWPLSFVRYGLILPLRSVFPLTALYVLLRLLRKKGALGLFPLLRQRFGRQLLRLWLSWELWFGIYYFIRRHYLQNRQIAPRISMTREERLAMGKKCLAIIDEIEDEGEGMPEESFLKDQSREQVRDILGSASQGLVAAGTELKRAEGRKMSVENLLRLWDENSSVMPNQVKRLMLKRAAVSGWFLGADVRTLKHGNIRQWIAWAFFCKEPSALTADEQSQATELVQQVEDWSQLHFEEGFNSQAKCIRLDFDPINSAYRPLGYYAVTYGLVSVLTAAFMYFFGFAKLRSGSLTYYYRAGKGSTKLPLFFCHGLGVGVFSYAPVIAALVSADPDRCVVCIELGHISMRPVETQAAPSELVNSVENLLRAHELNAIHLVGHSFGSIVCAWLVRFAPQKIQRITFLDPVCWLLCKHDIAYNFLYRTATTPGELLMQWFVGQELYIAHTLSRNFHWQDNIVWPESLTCPTTVVLSSEDHIVPSHTIHRYLRSWNKRLLRQRKPRSPQVSPSPTSSSLAPLPDSARVIDIEWLEGCGHAGFLVNRRAFRRVLAILRAH